MNGRDALAGFRSLAPIEAGTHEEGPAVAAAAAMSAARRQAFPLTLWVLACILAGVWYLHVTPNSYTATATLILDPRAPVQMTSDGTPPPLNSTLDSAQAESQIQVIRSERLLSMVFETLGLASSPELVPTSGGVVSWVTDRVRRQLGVAPPPPDSPQVQRAVAFANFEGRVGARRVGQSYVIEVSYTSEDPSVTYRYANAVVAAYLGQQVAFKAAAADNGAEFRQVRVTALANEVKAANDAVAAGRLPAAAMPDADARVIGAALQPLGKSSPKSGLVLTFAAAFGILTGLFVVAVRNGFDHRIRTPDQLARETGLECLGEVPEASRRIAFARPSSKAAIVDQRPDGDFAACMRNVRTAVGLAAGHGHKSIAIASWEQGSGRTLVASNLARTMAASGTDVTLVDAEVQRTGGGLTEYLPSDVATGLGQVLLGGHDAEALVRDRVSPHLSFVPAHARGYAPDARAYLGSDNMTRLIDDMARDGSVVVDLPALRTSPDARAVGGFVDGVVLVVEVGRTTKADLSQAMRALSASGAKVLGAVLNRA